jgi:aspartyl-tRNA(Asn)/glutamyl-tRNA(Gln) amidotransferase subunit C
MKQHVDETLVAKIAHLARLEFEPTSMQSMVEDMNRMLEFVDQLNEIDTQDVEPLIYLSDERNVLRPDVIGETLSVEQALVNAAKHDSDYFKVPRFVENTGA